MWFGGENYFFNAKLVGTNIPSKEKPFSTNNYIMAGFKRHIPA